MTAPTKDERAELRRWADAAAKPCSCQPDSPPCDHCMAKLHRFRNIPLGALLDALDEAEARIANAVMVGTFSTPDVPPDAHRAPNLSTAWLWGHQAGCEAVRNALAATAPEAEQAKEPSHGGEDEQARTDAGVSGP